MSSFLISVGFDAASMTKIDLLLGWVSSFRGTYEGFLEQAGLESLQALHLSAENHMWTTFMNPTGDLEGSLNEQMETPYRGWMGTDDPKARRRNWGFSGMTDSLGRYYPWDPGIEYMEYAISDMTSEIEGYYAKAINSAIAFMGI